MLFFLIYFMKQNGKDHEKWNDMRWNKNEMGPADGQWNGRNIAAKSNLLKCILAGWPVCLIIYCRQYSQYLEYEIDSLW